MEEGEGRSEFGIVHIGVGGGKALVGREGWVGPSLEEEGGWVGGGGGGGGRRDSGEVFGLREAEMGGPGVGGDDLWWVGGWVGGWVGEWVEEMV